MTYTPIMKTVRRTWNQRLFTWPWRPWVATQQVCDWKAEFARPSRATKDTVRAAMAAHKPPVVQRSPMRMPGTRAANETRTDASAPTDNVLRFVSSKPHDAARTPFTYQSGFVSGGGGEFTGGDASASYEAPSSSDSSSSSSSDGGSSSSSSSSSD